MTKLCDMGDVELVQLIIRARDNWLDVGPIKEELIRRLGRLRGRVAARIQIGEPMKTSNEIRAEAVNLLCGLTNDLMSAQRDAAVSAMEAMYCRGYNHGFNDGYDTGHDNGYAKGKREGRHEHA